MEFNATFLVSVISFILFTVLMNKIFYAPMGNIIAEREKFIDSAIKSAREADTKASAIIEERNIRLEQAKSDCKNIIASGIDKANTKAKTDTLSAKSEIAETISAIKNDIEKQGEAAQEILKISAHDLADTITEKILGKNA